jgi:hypothetical protein
MRGGGDGDELGQALDDAEEERVEEGHRGGREWRGLDE